MILHKNQIELLAPARDADAGCAAIDSGADAVYIGASRFGAREQAGNSLQDIENLVHYAHRYWARVYVTLNTLLRDDEIEEAVTLIHQLHDLGADGLIIQDAGLLACDLPPIPLIASTQMHNHTPERVAFLQSCGFQRAILARELSLEQIKAIRADTTLELEFFVHGALCVSYSGQCYLSQAIGGRSGNRGQCAQPCRRRYQLIDASGKIVMDWKHLLSLRDLNLSHHLSDLLDAGITSFKIEGRLKESGYVKNVVAFYRGKLDALLAGKKLHKSSSGSIAHDFTPDPAKSFNRGFTSYFLSGRDKTLTSWDSPKHVGEAIGRILQIGRDFFILEPGAPPIHAGDGLTFYTKSGQLEGTRVNQVQGGNIFPDRMEHLAAGMQLYRNLDHVFAERLKKERSERKIVVNMQFQETEDGFSLTASDEDGVTAVASIQAGAEPARDPERARSTIRTQLRKSGGTLFECREVTIAWQQPCFFPVAQLNALRRVVLDKLLSERLRHHPLLRTARIEQDVLFPEKHLDFHGNVLNRKAELFYRQHGVESIAPAAEAGASLAGERVMTMKYCIRGELGLCGGRLAQQGFQEPLYLLDEDGHRLRLDFRCEACEMDVYFPG